MGKNHLTLQTSLRAEELREQLKKWEPWSIRVDFNNGVSTNEFQRRIPFTEHPLIKFRFVEEAIPFAELSGGTLLDIGCNAGYNSINAATQYRLFLYLESMLSRGMSTSRASSQNLPGLPRNSRSEVRRLSAGHGNSMSSCTLEPCITCPIRICLFRQRSITCDPVVISVSKRKSTITLTIRIFVISCTCRTTIGPIFGR